MSVEISHGRESSVVKRLEPNPGNPRYIDAHEHAHEYAHDHIEPSRAGVSSFEPCLTVTGDYLISA